MQRQGSAQFVSAEEHQQLCFQHRAVPSIVSVLEKHFDLQQYLLGGGKGVLLLHQTSAFPQPNMAMTIP